MLRIVKDSEFPDYYRIEGSKRHSNTLMNYDEAVKYLFRYGRQFDPKDKSKMRDAFSAIKNIKLSYSDMYGTNIVASDIPKVSDYENSKSGTAIGREFVDVYTNDNNISDWKSENEKISISEFINKPHLLASLVSSRNSPLNADEKKLVRYILKTQGYENAWDVKE